MTKLILFPIVLLFAACSHAPSGTAPLKTVAKVDVNRYAGKWYEIARYPQWFQKDCVSATADYSRNKDGTVKVVNTCIRADGSRRSITGVAKPVDAEANRFQVSFPGNWYSKLIPVPEEGNYWVIDVTPGYQQAIVGTPDRKSLWFLSRSPRVPKTVFEKMKSTAKEQGFDPAKLEIDAHAKIGG